MSYFTKNKEITAAIIIALSSIIGSYIIATVVGSYTINSTRLLNKTTLEAVDKNIKAQIDSVNLANKTQIEAVLLANENSRQNLEESFENTIASIKTDNKIKEQQNLNQESREQKQETMAAINFFIADIETRLISIDSILNTIEELSTNLDTINTHNIQPIIKFNLYRLTLEINSIISAFSLHPIENNYIASEISKIPNKMAIDILSFYKLLQTLNQLDEVMEKKYGQLKEFYDEINNYFITSNNKKNTQILFNELNEFCKMSNSYSRNYVIKSLSGSIRIGLKALRSMNNYLENKANIELIDKKMKIFIDKEKELDLKFIPFENFIKKIENISIEQQNKISLKNSAKEN